MVKVTQCDVPPEWEEFWGKVCRWYGIKGVPCFARLWIQKMRRMKEIRYTISHFKQLGSAWGNLSDVTRQAWRDAAYKCWEYNRGYRLFTADYIYRLIAGLSVPGTPSDYHQLFGLEILNPGGSEKVQMRRDDKDIVGQINLKFNYKKTEIAPGGGNAFKVNSTLYYYIQGGYLTETDEFTAPAGNVGWNLINRTFGTADRKYFHYKVIFSIDDYAAEIFLNDIILTDKDGKFFSENFITKRNKAWVPKLLWRKKDWIFSPSFLDTYFKPLYLE